MRRPWVWVFAWSVAWLLSGRAAEGQSCFPACGLEAKVCVTASRLAKRACSQDCRNVVAVTDRRTCLRTCRDGSREERQRCRGEVIRCIQACLPGPTPGPSDCLRRCGGQLFDCIRQAGADVGQCAKECRGGSDLPTCLRNCADQHTAVGSDCNSAFHACVEQCRGTPGPRPCRCGMPCTNELGLEGVCLPAPSDPQGGCHCRVISCQVGQCLNVITGRCTGEACGPRQPCAGSGQVCDFLSMKCPCL